ncbi:hypothetical protein OA491_04520 [Alphaproteobacteria bacterium]|nr:hypothetical protein [Alphaproteobacteria bacterium]
MNKMRNKHITLILLILSILYSNLSFGSGKIYGKSQTINKEYKKYETCRLKKVEVNLKDGKKDGYKCIFRRQLKGKDVTVMQPSPQCQTSFKCKREDQN